MESSFSELECASKKKQTRQDRFLAEIEAITPWASLMNVLAPCYPSSGRPPVGLERILRMYVAQQCFGLSDEGTEDAVYDSQAIRRFVDIDLNREAAPDAATLLKFRHLLEAHYLTESIFNAISAHLADRGLFLREGTIVDATLIAASSSTKNKERKRDSEMHQTKKGNQWYFGMKAHIGVDTQSGLVHTLIGMTANVHDVTQTQALLHGDETDVLGDAGYQGIEKREENLELPVAWHIAMRPSMRKALPKTAIGELMEKLEHAEASIRAKVEHPFHVVKNLFMHSKTSYKGMAKNTAQLFSLFGFANLLLVRRWIYDTDSQVAS
jgi:IS5 family transposase